MIISFDELLSSILTISCCCCDGCCLFSMWILNIVEFPLAAGEISFNILKATLNTLWWFYDENKGIFHNKLNGAFLETLSIEYSTFGQCHEHSIVFCSINALRHRKNVFTMFNSVNVQCHKSKNLVSSSSTKIQSPICGKLNVYRVPWEWILICAFWVYRRDAFLDADALIKA